MDIDLIIKYEQELKEIEEKLAELYALPVKYSPDGIEYLKPNQRPLEKQRDRLAA